MSSSEKETSPVKGRVFKAHMKDKEKQEEAKMVQEVAGHVNNFNLAQTFEKFSATFPESSEVQ